MYCNAIRRFAHRIRKIDGLDERTKNRYFPYRDLGLVHYDYGVVADKQLLKHGIKKTPSTCK